MQHLIDRILSGRSIVVLCAPPGFRKRGVISAIKSQWHDTSLVQHFDAMDHEKSLRSAALALLETPPNGLIIITDAALTDHDFLVKALDHHAKKDSAGKVIISIDRPDILPLATLRINGLLDFVGPEQLELGQDEKREALKQAGRKVDRARIDSLSGTWPLAFDTLLSFVQSANDAMLDIADSGLLRACGLYDFLEQRITPLLSPAEVRVLTKASMITNPDVDILRGDKQDDRILSVISQKLEGLVTRCGDRFLINSALCAYLLEKSALDNTAQHYEDMVEMADRCSSLGRLHDAARLAAKANCPERISLYVEKHGAFLIWVLCGFSDVQALVENAGDEVIAQSPMLRIMRCIVEIKIGNISYAQSEYQRLADDKYIAASIDKELEIVRVTLLVYGCALARQHDLDMLTELLSEQKSQPAWQTFLATLGCVLNAQRGRLKIAFAHLREAQLQAERANSRYNLMYLCMHEAVIGLAQGKPNVSRSIVAKARKMWREEFPDDAEAEMVISALSASIEYETGRLTISRKALQKSAYRMPEAGAWFDIYFAAYEPMARLYCKDQGLTQALAFLQAEQGKLRACGLERVADLLAGLSICLTGEARLNGKPLPEQVAPIFSVEEDNPIWSWQEREIYISALTHLDYASGQIERALKRVQKACNTALNNGLNRSAMRYMILIYHLHKKTGDREFAMSEIRKIISLGSISGTPQIIVDMLDYNLEDDLRFHLFQEPLDEAEVQFLKNIYSKRSKTSQKKGTRLSNREIEILTLLAEGGSDKHLARTIGLSEHGVRYHLKNIFKKLQVHDRVSAIVAAERQSLLQLRKPDARGDEALH